MTEVATRRLPWLRISIEGVVIVVSVLLALAGDAWWDQRQERQREGVVLAGLEEDFEATLEAVARSRSVRERQDSFAAILISLDGAQMDQISAEEMDTLLARVLPGESFSPAEATLTALLNSDGLGIISNPELRTNLAEWPSLIAALRHDEALARTLFDTQFMPYLHERVPMRTMDAIGSPETGSLPHSTFSMDTRPLLSDLRFENHVNDILFFARLELAHLDEIERHSMETLDVLRSEVEDR